MANRAVVVDLLIRTGQFTAGLQRASAEMASETTNMTTKTRAFNAQIGLLGVAMTAFAAVAVVKWAQFDQAMQRIKATGGEAAERINDLNEAAKSDEVIKLGYDAMGASESIYELVKAGVSAADVINGAMSGSLALAAAEFMDASEAAQIMASALTQFNLAGEESGHVADLLTAGAVKAQGSAHQLGFALKQSGLVANQFGLGIEETVGTLTLFASAGLLGSDAGTSLRTMLLHLAGPSVKAAGLMKEIGLEVYGANGDMVDMVTLADNLQSSMGKLTEEQRNQALATIFGSDATRGASLLYREGGVAVQKWIDAVNESGYATRVASDMMDSLQGDIKKMSATWDRSMISLGESADGPMRNLVQRVTGLIDWFGELDPAIQNVLMAITGGGGLVILAVLGIGHIVGALTTLQAGLVATGVITQTTATRMATAFGMVTKAAGIIGLAIGVALAAVAMFKSTTDKSKLSVDALAEAYDVAAGKFTDVSREIAANQIVEDFSWWDRQTKGFDNLAEAAKRLNIPLSEVTDAMLGDEAAIQHIMDLNQVLNGIGGMSDGFADKQKALQPEIAALETYAEAGTNASDAAGILAEAISNNAGVSEEAAQKAKDFAEASVLTGDAAEGSAEAIQAQAESIANVTAEEVAAQKAYEEYIGSIVDSFTSFLTLSDVYQGVIDTQKDWATSAAEATEDTSDSWENFYDGQAVSSEQYIAELEKQVVAQEEWAANLLSLTSRVKETMPADLQAAAQEMIAELRNLGPEGAAQVALLGTMSDTELAAVVELYRRQGTATGEAWASEVDAVENPEVGVDTEQAQADVDDLKINLNALANTSVVIPVQVSTAGATANIKALQSLTNGSWSGGTSQGPFLPGHAGGGSVVGAGTGMSDSVLARLSNGEHVLTASDVQKAGGQSGVYQMRAAIQSGMLRFATGGAVGGKSLEYWERARLDQGEILSLQIQIQNLQKDLAARGKSKITGLERSKAGFDLGEAQRELSEGLYANSLNAQKSIESRIAEQEALEKKAENEADRKARIADQKADYSQDINRGEFTDGATSNLSGAYSTIDRLRSGVVSDLVGPQKTALADALDAAEQNAKALYASLNDVDGALESATDKAEELQAVSDKVQDGLVGGFGLSDFTSTSAVNPFTGAITSGAGSQGRAMLGAAQAYSGKVRTFAGKLQSLADRGFAGVILQEIAAMGVEAGIPAADALLSLDPTDTSALNTAYQDISTFSGQVGQAVTEGFYAGGLAAADGIIAGLEDRKTDIQEAIMQMALDMQTALKTALEIASPSRKFRALMQYVGDGIVLGLDDQTGAVADASGRLFDGVSVPGYSAAYGAGGVSSGVGGDLVASLSDAQVERLAVAFETGNVRNINAATAQQNRKAGATYGARGR